MSYWLPARRSATLIFMIAVNSRFAGGSASLNDEDLPESRTPI
jgi:hypothetical protein